MTVLSRLEIVLAANSASFTQSINDARSQTKVAFSDMREYANKMGPAVAASVGAAALATTALVADQIALASELQHTANVANSSIKEIQKYTVGAKKMGIEQETLGAIFQDTTDKIGDFLSTGGGGMADYFENVAPLIGQTAEEFRTLSGPQALQLYYDGLEKANLSQNEMTFYMEAMASDATSLIPLLADGGAGFDTWATAAGNAGAVMDAETIRATKELQATIDLLELSVDGAKTQFVAGFIPVLSDAAGELVGTADAADAMRIAGQNVGEMLKSVSKIGVGAATVFETIGTAIGGFAAGVGQLGNGVDWDSPFAFFQMGQNFIENNRSAAQIFAEIPGDISDIWLKSADQISRIDKLGTGTANSTINSVIALNERQAALNRTLGQTGQQYQAQQAAADAAAKSAEKAAKAAKNLGASYVSNTALSGLKLKSNEAIAGGMARGYTAEFAEITQSLIGSNLKYFSAINDTYHEGTSSRHATGQAFDIVLNDAKQAAQAAALIEQAAKQYGYSVKILDEYAKPSKNATGGHLHVSVLGQTAKKNGGADLQYIKQQNTEAARLAAEQTRVAEQQAQQRASIRMEYANEVVRIETKLQDKIAAINASDFNDDERLAFIADAEERARIDVANYEDAQARKLAAFSNFTRSEKELITQNAVTQATSVLRDLELTEDARTQALEFIKQKVQYELNQLDLTHDREMQYAQQSEQTDIERIRNQYALERREIELTVSMDEQLRTAKIDALNQAEQLALDERRYAYERELRDLTSIGRSDLAALRADYADQRRVLELRRDISPEQKFKLYQGIDGAQKYDTNELQKAPRDAFESQQAAFNGSSASYGIAQQYKQRLQVIEDAEKAELDITVDYQQAKLAARMEFENAATQLSFDSSQALLGNLTSSFKTMMGEQNLAYQLMFAGQQSFVMASAGLNMYEAWGDAMAEGATMSQKLVGAATIAAEFGRIITAASSMTLELPGYRDGGYTGDAPEDQIVGYVHGREHVSDAATTRQYRPELEAMSNGTYERQGNNTAPNVNVSVTVTMEGNSSVESESQYGKQIGQGLAAVVVSEVTKMTRPNGKLDRLYAKR